MCRSGEAAVLEEIVFYWSDGNRVWEGCEPAPQGEALRAAAEQPGNGCQSDGRLHRDSTRARSAFDQMLTDNYRQKFGNTFGFVKKYLHRNQMNAVI